MASSTRLTRHTRRCVVHFDSSGSQVLKPSIPWKQLTDRGTRITPWILRADGSIERDTAIAIEPSDELRQTTTDKRPRANSGDINVTLPEGQVVKKDWHWLQWEGGYAVYLVDEQCEIKKEQRMPLIEAHMLAQVARPGSSSSSGQQQGEQQPEADHKETLQQLEADHKEKMQQLEQQQKKQRDQLRQEQKKQREQLRQEQDVKRDRLQQEHDAKRKLLHQGVRRKKQRKQQEEAAREENTAVSDETRAQDCGDDAAMQGLLMLNNNAVPDTPGRDSSDTVPIRTALDEIAGALAQIARGHECMPPLHQADIFTILIDQHAELNGAASSIERATLDALLMELRTSLKSHRIRAQDSKRWSWIEFIALQAHNGHEQEDLKSWATWLYNLLTPSA